MTTRRTFIAGLLASAAAPAQAQAEPSWRDVTWDQLFANSLAPGPLVGPFRRIYAMGCTEPQIIRWCEPQDFTDWSQP